MLYVTITYNLIWRTYMKALYFTADKTMELRDIAVPVPKTGQYLIRVKMCGICGSDFEGYMGKTGRRTPPMIMGHEFAGVITEAPEGGKFKKGESVVVFPKPFCGTCEYCKKGLVNVCTSGICMGVLSANGAMCEYVAVDEKYLIPFSPEKLPYDIASMTEPLSVAYRAVYKISDEELQASDHIVVIGAGTIGLLVTAMLAHRKAKHIIVSDTQEFRLEAAKKMGAHTVVNPASGDFEEAIKKATDGKKCDFSIEAVGISATAESSLDALKIGGTAIWIGNAQKIVSINMQKIVTTELSVRGSYVYDFDGFKKCVELLQDKVIDVSSMITNTYKLQDGVAAFKSLENNTDGKMLKVMLEV